MSEYIEREAAIEMIKNDLPEQARYYRQDAIECLECMPTADVVPKSEVERLQAEVDQLHALLECGVFANSVEDWQKFLNEKRAEVAREIFEEIEKWLVHEYVPYIRGYSNSLARNFAKLKKKYVESENG